MVAGVFLFAVSIAFTGCTRVILSEGGVDIAYDHQASREDRLDLEINSGEMLQADVPTGSMQIQASSSGKPGLVAKVTSHGRSPQDAREALDLYKINAVRTAAGATIQVESDPAITGALHTKQRAAITIQMVITVPENVKLQISTRAGAVQATGPFLESSIDCRYGSIALDNATGAVRVKSSSGSLNLANIARAPAISAATSYGSIILKKCAADQVDAESSSGAVAISDVSANTLRVHSSYGKLSFERVRGDISAKSASGGIMATDLGNSTSTFETSYGSVNCSKARGNLTFRSASGSVRAEEVDGAIVAISNYGSVHVQGVLKRLEAETSSGSVNVTALPGSALDGDWLAKSGFGSVKITIPDTFVCELDASTSYGSIDCDFPVLTPGGKRKEKTLTGIMNATDAVAKLPRLQVKSGSGSIHIRRSN